MAKITFEIVGELVALLLFSLFLFVNLTVVYVVKFPYANQHFIEISKPDKPDDNAMDINELGFCYNMNVNQE